ncbi:MAG: hypothetical protein QNK26_17485 [Moritella sp.]|uniref:hypothetical protein n=1 Tax=Moritella sp. TaxID=78556 RepID=UPI0029A9F9B2|nr:hypothetical protein [Moritella sp.]MDX2322381.1 hypothetical protein [Moritella sp.]
MSDIIGTGSNISKVNDKDVEELKKHSRFLRKIAWLVEIIVVFIGLCISISLMTSNNDLTSAFTLAAPFVMISLVELTKIPFVIGLWHSRKSFLMYLLIISFLCLITFETLLNGFERAFSSINRQINLSEIEISKIENQIKINEDNIAIALQDYNIKTQQIDSDTMTVNANYKSQYANEVRRNKRLSKDIPVLSRAITAKKEQLIQLKIEKSELLQELSLKKEQRFKSSMERTQGSADLVQTERNRLLAQLDKLNVDKVVALDDSNFFTSPGVKKDYDEKIRYVETQLNNINNNTIIVKDNSPDLESVQFLDDYYADLLGLKDDMIQQKNEEVQQLRRRYNNAVSASNSNLAVKQRQLANNKTTALRNLEIKRDQTDVQFLSEKDYIKEIKQNNMTLRYDIRVIEIEANTVALSNQVYRMASYIDNVDHYKEVKTETLTLVGLVWFGSLALIGSITGIALTLSGLHLNSLAKKREQKARVYVTDES